MSAQRYLVTARKYRPQIFSELVAQEHVTETLKNAIRLDRLAHAYLFSGPRGVGKTTAARILAKAINCSTPLEGRDGGAEPCRTCDSCRTFEEGRSLNIIEIDAASNNKVDDIRDLRETVRVPPQGGRKKVYIVDEVHMLTTQAFNALLKTLEEPPPHVLFIFATTEPHKVLPTILSRCQRFDFRRIAVSEILSRLQEICKEENVTADEASLMLIARKGDGALRDALSVFDQAVSLCGSKLVYTELAQALGVVDVDLYFEVTDLITAQDSAGMLRLVERTVRSGHDLQEFLAGLAEHLRNLLVAHTMQDASLIEAAGATRQRYMAAADDFTEADLLRLLTLAADAEDSIKASVQPRLKLETALLKMAAIALAADLRAALDKIERLETLAREGKLPALEPEASSQGMGAADERELAPDHKGAAGERDTSSDRRSVAATGERDTSSDRRSVAATGERELSSDRKTAADDEREIPSDPGAAAASHGAGLSGGAPASGEASRGDEPPSHSTGPESRASERQEAAAGASGAGASVLGTPALKRKTADPKPSEAPVATETAVVDDAEAGPIAGVWDELLERVRQDKIQVWSLLHHTRPEGYESGTVRIAVPNDFHRRVLASQEAYVIEHLRPLAEVPVRSLHFVVREDAVAPDAEETASEFDPYEYMKRKRQENPIVRAIFDQFGGELVW